MSGPRWVHATAVYGARGPGQDRLAVVDLVRLPTGGLKDDIAIVLCRPRPTAGMIASTPAAVRRRAGTVSVGGIC